MPLTLGQTCGVPLLGKLSWCARSTEKLACRWIRADQTLHHVPPGTCHNSVINIAPAAAAVESFGPMSKYCPGVDGPWTPPWPAPPDIGCSVLFSRPSSIRRLATPWTYFLHSSLSSVILTDSSTGSPVHVLMLSVQAARGLPRLRPIWNHHRGHHSFPWLEFVWVWSYGVAAA